MLKAKGRTRKFSTSPLPSLKLLPLSRQAPSDLPVPMRYRNCQRTYKQNVAVFRSSIHGLGLYCISEIEPGDMVIEYAGTVIRSVLTDKREKYYDSKVGVTLLNELIMKCLVGYRVLHVQN